MFQVGERKRSRRTLEAEKPPSRRRLSIESIAANAPLRGAVVCLTGLPPDEKTRLHDCVEQLGGSFSRDLDTAKTTHLIAQDPEGAKYDTAIACSKIRVVSPAWLDECAKTGTRADEKQYSLTQDNDESEFPPLEQEIEHLLGNNNRNDLFESCRFLLLGFETDSAVKGKLSRLIRRGKGTIYWELNETITHIIVADDCGEMHRDAARTISLYHPNGPTTVSPFWVASSWKDNNLASPAKFPPRKTATKEASKKKAANPSRRKQQPSSLFRGSVFALLRLSPSEGAIDFDSKEIETCITSHGGQLLSSELLEALRADKASKDSQLRNCYVVCWGGYTPAHMMVHPLLSWVEREKLCVVLPVTPIWLHSCNADGKLVKPNKNPNLFQPRSWSIQQLPDSKRDKEDGIKVSVSGFVGSERTGIIQALRVIGAHYTENLRSTNTHLICKENKGPKYEMAVKWGLEVVSVEWLYHIMEHRYCGRDGNDEDEGCENRFSLVRDDKTDASREKSREPMEEEEAPRFSQASSEGGLSLHDEFESEDAEGRASEERRPRRLTNRSSKK